MTNGPIVCALLACAAAFAQRPSNPALLVPQVAPELDYVAVPNPLPLPESIKLGAEVSFVGMDDAIYLFEERAA